MPCNVRGRNQVGTRRAGSGSVQARDAGGAAGELEEGDILTLYTDGVVETANPDDDFYGMARLVSLVKDQATSSATEICSGIMQDVRRHGGGARTDDRTLVVMKATPF